MGEDSIDALATLLATEGAIAASTANDCDGDTDKADSDCATGGLPSGASCMP